MVKKFRTKTVIKEAIQLTEANALAVAEFVGAGTLENNEPEIFMTAPIELYIPTLEGVMKAQAGDWIIKGLKGEFYPCKPEVFAKTYEPVED